ncbi:MAG: hypothetical protein NT050_03810, partial [Verrucomicrobia bacterium]|nr:hypothetical protein [Verrucomicrobiota bacterium]
DLQRSQGALLEGDGSLSGSVLRGSGTSDIGAFEDIALPRKGSGEAEFVEGPWDVAQRPPR